MFKRLLALTLAIAMFSSWSLAVAMLLQDIAGGAIAFRGQDIMGGAAIVFNRPQRVRDVVGGAALLIVKRQPRPAISRAEIARNTSDRRRTQPRPGEGEAGTAALSDADKGEAFKNQGNTYYDLGQYAKAIEAYQNALKHTPNDSFIYNNLGAAYFSTGKNNEAIQAFQKALSLKANDPDTLFNLGIAYAVLEKHEEALKVF